MHNGATVDTHNRVAFDIPIRVLVADQQPLIRFGLKLLIDAERGLQVIGEADSYARLVELSNTTNPDVLVVEPEFDDCPVVDVLTGLRNHYPALPILVFAAQGHDLRVVEALRAGVHGYVTKRIETTKLVEAIYIVASGRQYLDPEITSMVTGHLAACRRNR